MLYKTIQRIKLTDSQIYLNVNLLQSLRYVSNMKHDPSTIAIDGTMQNVKDKFIRIMGVKKRYQPISEQRSHLLQYLPSSQADLPPRKMSDSFSSAIIPLSNDAELQDKYVAFLGNVRLGRLLEDMDFFAAQIKVISLSLDVLAFIAQKHILNPKQPEGKPSPYVFVTALIDRIDFTDYIPKPKEDIRLSGHASWVGKSSIEIVVWLEQKSHGEWKKLTRALFLMAARNATVEKAAAVNSLVATNKQEQHILDNGEIRRKHRLLVQSQHLTKVIPNAEEQTIIHKLFVRTVDVSEISFKRRTIPSGSVWMESCTLSNLIFSHPENRNLQNTVFGGFMMRQALELSWALGFLYSKYRPTLKSISDISFSHPIQVNSLIRMYAYVAYTQKQFFQVTLYAEALNSPTDKSHTTNAFHFTYETPEVVPEIFPHSYQEAMMYIDARRHFLHVMSPEKLKKA